VFSREEGGRGGDEEAFYSLASVFTAWGVSGGNNNDDNDNDTDLHVSSQAEDGLFLHEEINAAIGYGSELLMNLTRPEGTAGQIVVPVPTVPEATNGGGGGGGDGGDGVNVETTSMNVSAAGRRSSSSSWWTGTWALVALVTLTVYC